MDEDVFIQSSSELEYKDITNYNDRMFFFSRLLQSSSLVIRPDQTLSKVWCRMGCPSLSFLGVYTQLEMGHLFVEPGAQRDTLGKGDRNDIDTYLPERKEVYFFNQGVLLCVL